MISTKYVNLDFFCHPCTTLLDSCFFHFHRNTFLPINELENFKLRLILMWLYSLGYRVNIGIGIAHYYEIPLIYIHTHGIKSLTIPAIAYFINTLDVQSCGSDRGEPVYL